jgi:hypothetical protein
VRTTIKHLVKMASLAIVLSVMAVAASAQTSGTVTINGSVGSSASIRWWAYTALNTEAGVNAGGNIQNDPLAFTLALGDVSPVNPNNYAGGKVKLILRSNAAYTVNAQVTASSGFTGGAGDIALTDIGFGLANKANSGALVSGDPATGSAYSGSFGNDPSAAVKNANGVPTFPTSLNNVASGATSVLSGPRISKGGSVSSPNNGLLVDTIYAVGPQYFTPVGAFSATITYTITTP